MRINTNLNAMTALNSATKNTALAGSSMEKLSSGLKINKAADNATGLAISEKMRSQIRGLDQASQNTQDGISVVQTAEGAIEEVGNIVQRMRELSVQCANESNSGEDREKIVIELNELHEEIDRISNSTQFNEKDLLNGQTVIRIEKQYTITKGAAMNDQISKIQVQRGFDFSDLDLGGLGFVSSGIGKGRKRIENAIQDALKLPLCDGLDISEAKRLLLNFTYGKEENVSLLKDMDTIKHFIETMSFVETTFGFERGSNNISENAVKVTVVASGFEKNEK